MPFIGKNPTSGFSTIVKDDFTPDGSTTAFTLSKNVASANDIAVFVGNVRQEPTDAYSVLGTTLTMTAAPASGLNFYVLHIAGTLESSVVPADGTITNAKLNLGQYFQLPSGTEAQRPSSPVEGMTRYNTDDDLVEVYADGAWIPIGNQSKVISTDYLVVAGGGSGNDGYINANFVTGGGGGAGGMLTGTESLTSGTTYTITVGAGGAWSFAENTAASGNASSIVGGTLSITTVGGGGGGKQSRDGADGGSGGGGGSNTNTTSSGTTGQGNDGGAGANNPSSADNAGGGGGKGSAGGTPTAGNGEANSITGSSVTYAAGGTGGSNGSGNGSNAAVNTGNGGNGGGQGSSISGGNGGSGVVILKLLTSEYTGVSTGSPTVTTDGSYTIIKFTQTGSYTA